MTAHMEAAAKTAEKFHRLAVVAAKNGGFWVSAGGGTARVVAGVIARATGVSFEEAMTALDEAAPKVWGRPGGWYIAMAESQPWPVAYVPEPEEARWDARQLARYACQLVLK